VPPGVVERRQADEAELERPQPPRVGEIRGRREAEIQPCDIGEADGGEHGDPGGEGSHGDERPQPEGIPRIGRGGEQQENAENPLARREGERPGPHPAPKNHELTHGERAGTEEARHRRRRERRDQRMDTRVKLPLARHRPQLGQIGRAAA